MNFSQGGDSSVDNKNINYAFSRDEMKISEMSNQQLSPQYNAQSGRRKIKMRSVSTFTPGFAVINEAQ